jgi:DNA modification methylase
MPTPTKHSVNRMICGDAHQVLKQLLDESVDCVVTSPPYWALRNYGIKGQIGLEQKFLEYIAKLCDIYDEIKWVPLGICRNLSPRREHRKQSQRSCRLRRIRCNT